MKPPDVLHIGRWTHWEAVERSDLPAKGFSIGLEPLGDSLEQVAASGGFIHLGHELRLDPGEQLTLQLDVAELGAAEFVERGADGGTGLREHWLAEGHDGGFQAVAQQAVLGHALGCHRLLDESVLDKGVTGHAAFFGESGELEAVLAARIPHLLYVHVVVIAAPADHFGEQAEA